MPAGFRGARMASVESKHDCKHNWPSTCAAQVVQERGCTCTSDVTPQYAGSACVVNCWISLKKPCMWPACSASWKSCRPAHTQSFAGPGVEALMHTCPAACLCQWPCGTLAQQLRLRDPADAEEAGASKQGQRHAAHHHANEKHRQAGFTPSVFEKSIHSGAGRVRL
jgi:hypothetical protein